MWTYQGKEEEGAKLKMERCMQERHDRGVSERGQDNKQGSMEEYDHQLHRRPHMTGHVREEEDGKCKCTKTKQ